MYFLTWFILGLTGAVITIIASRPFERVHTVLGLMLIIAAFWYSGFALYADAGSDALWPQAIAAAFFAYCGFQGLRGNYTLLGLGWLMHFAWDFFSTYYLQAHYMPAWTLPACASFDTAVAWYCYQQARTPVTAQSA